MTEHTCCVPSSDSSTSVDHVPGDLSPEMEQLRAAGFELLFESGAPVPIDALAERAEWTVDKTLSTLSAIEAAGRARRNVDGELVGIAGLSVEPTSHLVEIKRRGFWTWCALDAVGIFTALKATGSITSTAPGRVEKLEIRFVDGATDSDYALFLSDGYDGSDVFDSWCPNVNFFASVDDANSYAELAGLSGQALAISEVAEIAETMWAPVVSAVSDSVRES